MFNLKELLGFIKLMKRNSRLYAVALILSSIAYPSMYILYAFVNKELIRAVTQKDLSILYNVFILIFLIIAGSCIIDPIGCYVRGYTVRKIINEIREDVINHLLEMPLSYFETHDTGKLMSILSNDLNIVEDAFRNCVRMVIVTTVMAIGSLISIYILEWRLFIVAIILGVLFFLSNTIFVKKIRLLGEDIQKRLGSITSLMVEIISGVTDMKLFKMGQVVTKRYFRQNEVLTNQIIKRISKLSQVEAINFFWSSFNFLGILIIGLIMIKSGKTDLSTVIAVITLQNNITFMFLNIGIFVNNIQSALASTNVILTVLNEEPESNSEENKDVSHIATYTQEMISLNNVSFSYDNKKSILSNANLNINEGENIVVIGPSGCGKTTLFKLLMGFYKKTAGEIIINHKEISNYTLGDLRNITAYVSQDAFMFEGTIRENIQFGKMNATDTEIIKAAQMANAHNFIMELPEGYNTRIGINGMGLSGGQKQRIAIARAILKDAPILLLDEATAALDSENEDIVQHALNVLMKGKTVITIAHKLQTIQNADNVYMLKDGTFEAQCISKLQTN